MGEMAVDVGTDRVAVTYLKRDKSPAIEGFTIPVRFNVVENRDHLAELDTTLKLFDVHIIEVQALDFAFHTYPFGITVRCYA
jgi:hypothetical protein